MSRTRVLSFALGLVILVAAFATARTSQNGAQQPHDPVADSLVTSWLEAIGGLERYWELRTARFTLVTEIYDAESGRLRRTRPRYVWIARTNAGELARIERWEGDDFIVQGWDGTTAWATRNGEPLSAGDKDFDEVNYVASDVNYWPALPYKLRDGGLTLHDDGRDDANRRTVRVTFGADIGDHQDLWHYFFEDDRSWPVEVRYQEEGKTSINRTRWEDIRTVDGYVFVGRRVHFDDEGRVTKVLRTEDFTFNADFDLEIFSRH